MLLKNCAFILTQNKKREILRDNDVLIEQDKIVKIGKGFSKKNRQVIDCSNKIVLPGMINSHIHLPMTMFRGYLDSLPLRKWLSKVIELEKKLTKEKIYYGTLLGCLECIRFGTTTIADFYYFPFERAKAIEKSGLNGFLDSTVMDKPLFFNNADDAIKNAEKFIKKYINHKYIKPIATAHSIYLCSNETLKKINNLSEKYDILKRIHISETEKEFRETLSKYKNTPVEYLDSIGWLNEKTILVHANWITNIEIRKIAGKKCKICHNPTSNLKLAYGKVMPLDKLIGNNVTVSVATDGPTSNNNLDIFEELKLAALLNKFTSKVKISDQKIFDMANLSGARTLGIESITGSIEPGKRADIITINLDKPHLYPINKNNSIISHIIYCANGNDVSETIVRGNLLMNNKKILDPDERRIINKVQKLTGGEIIWKKN
ncbi:amidohydrolase family protein [Candidatus Woesearchaeota archaeon]|nr:amidohydrolase family protein [Candidatus Woesearchaeota archaeon]